MKRNILEYLEKNAKCCSEKIAVTDGCISYTYKELLDISRRIGSALAKRVDIGAPIAVIAEKTLRLSEFLWELLKQMHFMFF